jgi:hypothetical protein
MPHALIVYIPIRRCRLSPSVMVFVQPYLTPSLNNPRNRKQTEIRGWYTGVQKVFQSAPHGYHREKERDALVR